MSWNHTKVSNFYTSWSSLLTFSSVCTTQFNSFTFNLGQRIKIKIKNQILFCKSKEIIVTMPKLFHLNGNTTGFVRKLQRYRDKIFILVWGWEGKEMSIWLLSGLCNSYFTYRILDKLKSSSAESQVQIHRLTEDLVQAKVHEVMIQWGLMKSKLMMKQFNNIRIFIEIWDASYW